MKFVDEYRDRDSVRKMTERIHKMTTGKWTLMEVCGGQTHAIVRFGIDRMLPEGMTLVHGPGCPVCVTPANLIDRAVELSCRQEVILASYGDMLRVPGSSVDLLTVRAQGGDVRVVYSPLDAVKIAADNPDRVVVFFAVGFETTTPTAAAAILTAERETLDNFTLLSAHFLVPPALEAILSEPDCRVQGLIAPGHVCTVTGYVQYEELASRYRVPIAVTGFEPLDILQGIYLCLQQLEEGRFVVENQYSRVVKREGSLHAQALMNRVFETCDRNWRGIGVIPLSGLAVRQEFRNFDAEARFGFSPTAPNEPTECISGQVLRGVKRPTDCPAFGGHCTPERPLGAPMVSSEGACAAYYRYRR